MIQYNTISNISNIIFLLKKNKNLKQELIEVMKKFVVLLLQKTEK